MPQRLVLLDLRQRGALVGLVRPVALTYRVLPPQLQRLVRPVKTYPPLLLQVSTAHMCLYVFIDLVNSMQCARPA